MDNNSVKQSLCIDSNNTVVINGVSSLDSLTTGEAVVKCVANKVIIKGSHLVLHDLDSDSGKAIINSTAIHSIQYSNTNGKTNWKSLFGK